MVVKARCKLGLFLRSAYALSSCARNLQPPIRISHQKTDLVPISERAFFVVCWEAGIDAGRLRHHLQDFHSVNKYLSGVLLTIIKSKD
jgi:hypothetical protein